MSNTESTNGMVQSLQKFQPQGLVTVSVFGLTILPKSIALNYLYSEYLRQQIISLKTAVAVQS